MLSLTGIHKRNNERLTGPKQYFVKLFNYINLDK